MLVNNFASLKNCPRENKPGGIGNGDNAEGEGDGDQKFQIHFLEDDAMHELTVRNEGEEI